MLKRLLEILFGLDRGFFNGPGELGVHFDPHWPGPGIGEPGHWQNYLLGVVAIVMLLVLARKTATRQFHKIRLVLAAVSAAMVAILIPAFIGLHGWDIALL